MPFALMGNATVGNASVYERVLNRRKKDSFVWYKKAKDGMPEHSEICISGTLNSAAGKDGD